MVLPRTAWVRLNRLHTGVRRFRSCLQKWGMAPATSAGCKCGAEEQTFEYVVLQCAIRRPLHGLLGLTILVDETVEWLLNTWPARPSSGLKELAQTIERTRSNKYIMQKPWNVLSDA